MTGQLYLLILTQETDVPESLPAEIIACLDQAGIQILQAYRSRDSWFVQVRTGEYHKLEKLAFPAGWHQAAVIAADEGWRQSPMNDAELRLGDPLAFAFLQWPAVIALFELSGEGWGLVLYVFIAAWLLLFMLAGYLGRYRKTPQFGNALLLANLAIAIAWWLQSVIWSLVATAIAMLLLYVAQRALMRLHEGHRPPGQ